MGKNSIDKQNYANNQTMLFTKGVDNQPILKKVAIFDYNKAYKKDGTIVVNKKIDNASVVMAEEKIADKLLQDKTQIMKLQAVEENKKEAQREIEHSRIVINGKIDDFEQGGTGDCWALTGIRALANTKKGAEAIKNSISQDKNGNVTVKLKGVNESYTFTTAQIKKAEGRLSTGDDDMRVLEMAMEQHRLNIIKGGFYLGKGDMYGNGTTQSPLTSGCPDEAISLLTGKDSEYYSPDTSFASALISLSKIKKNPDKYAGATSFKKEDGPMIDCHSFSIKSVGDQSVTVVNPWDSSKSVKIGDDKFLGNYDGIAIFDAEQ